AQTLAVIYELAGPASWHPEQYEFQCLHGMGETLYEQVVGSIAGGAGRPCRIYAPVGTHETLLAYLVRRLLENGANTSFVNRVADPSIPVETLIEDPVSVIRQMAETDACMGLPHPGIPLPEALYGSWRKNSRGLDLANDDVLESMVGVLRSEAQENIVVETGQGPWVDVVNPADCTDVLGRVRYATAADAQAAISTAAEQADKWADVPPSQRAQALQHAADAMEADILRLIGILVREAGKTYANAVAEVREAVDFLRYYSAQVETQFNDATHRPLGVVICISPWNFPLAIFSGQIAAALAAGNVV